MRYIFKRFLYKVLDVSFSRIPAFRWRDKLEVLTIYIDRVSRKNPNIEAKISTNIQK